MLRFTVDGQIIQIRELKTAKDKGDRVWRRQWTLAYQGGTVEVVFGTESDHDLALWKAGQVGHEVEVHGHVGDDMRGKCFFYGGHTLETSDSKALKLLLSHGMTEQQARAILDKNKPAAPSGKGVA